jgi:hypothetical protein
MGRHGKDSVMIFFFFFFFFGIGRAAKAQEASNEKIKIREWRRDLFLVFL